MSMHNHFTAFSEAALQQFDRIGLEDPQIGKPFPRCPADPAEYFRAWISTPTVAGQEDGPQAPSFFDLEAGYWAERRRSNFLLVHYNDLKRDLGGEMRRIASFLDEHIDEQLWPSLVAAADFKAMRAAGADLMPQINTMFREGAERFFHKGVNGRWRDILTSDDLAAYDAKVRAKLTPGLANWLENGRLATCDPRDAQD